MIYTAQPQGVPICQFLRLHGHRTGELILVARSSIRSVYRSTYYPSTADTSTPTVVERGGGEQDICVRETVDQLDAALGAQGVE